MIKYTLIAIPLLFSAILSISGCGKSDISKSSQVLARVGEKEITKTYFDRQLANLPESVQKVSTLGEGKKAVLEGLINREIIYAEAVKKKLDKDPIVQRQLDDARKEMIVKAYLQKELAGKIKVEDKEVEAFYRNNPEEYQHREEVRISQIVVKDEAKAEEMIKKLGIRRDFADLATTHSTDKASAARNGDVGWFAYQALPKDVRDGVFKLRIGEVSKPYKRGDSYEIYKLTDRRVLSYPLQKVSDVIKLQIYEDKFRKELKTTVDGLKKTTSVQVNETLLQ